MKKLIPISLLVLPVLAFAQLTQTETLITRIGDMVRIAIPILLGIALLVFFWGVVKFIWSASETGKTDGKNFMLWGIIALFVMVSIWGLINFLQNELDLDLARPSADGLNPLP